MQDAVPVADSQHTPSSDAISRERDEIARLCLEAYAKLPPKSGKPKQDDHQKCASTYFRAREPSVLTIVPLPFPP
jgi:hypothetical protein